MALPIVFINSLKQVKGFDKEAFEKVHQSGIQVTSIRINPSKKIPSTSEGLEKIPWTSNGFYLPERPSFTLDPLFHGGAYYVQEASSMFLEEMIKQTVDLSKSIKVLDLCAAPGGKSTLIHSLISDTSILVSNEVIKPRVTILSENLTKWGALNVVVTNNDPKDFRRLENYFDVIVVDAPCSGSGLFRKDTEAINEWSEQNVALCSQRQQRILADVLPALKAGGILIYSTCSYSTQEDEVICDWLMNDCHLASLKCLLEPDWNIVETNSPINNGYGYRFYPDKVKGEGFFIAAFKKATDIDDVRIKKEKTKLQSVPAKELEAFGPWLKNITELSFIKVMEDIIAIPYYMEKDLASLQSSLYIKKAGVKIGAVIRAELIPAHDLAMSTILTAEIPSIEVPKETALQFLRREEIKLESAKTGWVLLTYLQLPLGWVKVLSNRVNNYYPKDWRILHK